MTAQCLWCRGEQRWTDPRLCRECRDAWRADLADLAGRVLFGLLVGLTVLGALVTMLAGTVPGFRP